MDIFVLMEGMIALVASLTAGYPSSPMTSSPALHVPKMMVSITPGRGRSNPYIALNFKRAS